MELVDIIHQKRGASFLKNRRASESESQNNYGDILNNLESGIGANSGLLQNTSQSTKYEIITEAFLKTNEELSSRNFDVSFSGTTAVTLLLIGNRLICPNVGDSRAIMASYKSASSLKNHHLLGDIIRNYDEKVWVATPLSRDHKPDDEDEFNRIMQNNGRVEPFRGI